MQELHLESPYAAVSGSRRFRGSWHNHMHKSLVPPREAVALCRSGGFDFLGVTDHDTRYRDLPWGDEDWAASRVDGFVVIRGFELSHPLGHVSCLGQSPAEAGVDLERVYGKVPEGSVADAVYDGYIDRARDGGAFLALNHPAAWRERPEELLAVRALTSMRAAEVYNGNRMKKGWEHAYAGDVIDLCLSRGMRLWVAANPDCHAWDVSAADSPFNGYSVVFADSLTPTALLAALERGSFYASSGLEIEDIRVDAGAAELVVESRGCARTTFIGSGGAVLAQVAGPRARYRFRGEEGYVRAELESDTIADRGLGSHAARAWLQPVWVGPRRSRGRSGR